MDPVTLQIFPLFSRVLSLLYIDLGPSYRISSDTRILIFTLIGTPPNTMLKLPLANPLASPPLILPHSTQHNRSSPPPRSLTQRPGESRITVGRDRSHSFVYKKKKE